VKPKRRTASYQQAKPEPQQSTPPKATPASPASSWYNSDSYKNYQQQAPPSNETGLTPDPHPGGVRKMVDPMKYVREVKAEVARDNNVDPANIDLWCNGVKLDDSKRLYEYQQVQHYRIEIRGKGDVPR
jgi:hypothetical protein